MRSFINQARANAYRVYRFVDLKYLIEYRELLDHDSDEQAWANNVALNAFCRLDWGRIALRMRLIEEFINSSFYDCCTEQLIGYAGPSGQRFVIDKPLINHFLHLPIGNNTLLDAIPPTKLREYHELLPMDMDSKRKKESERKRDSERKRERERKRESKRDKEMKRESERESKRERESIDKRVEEVTFGPNEDGLIGLGLARGLISTA